LVHRCLWALALLLVALGSPAATPTFIGSTACAGCHAQAARAWQDSHHALARQRATPASVLGDFNQARVDHHGQRTDFYRQGARYVVRTEGADGQRREYDVAEVLGVYPLQQLLIALPGGRLQAFGIAWDTRPRTEGGQRWFALYPDDPPVPGDPLHWSGREQNANFMCQGCHSTGFRAGYDANADTYRSTQAERGVGCEACHGAGSGHRAWALAGRPSTMPHKGFAAAQARLKPLRFSFLPGQAIAQPQGSAAQGQAASEVCLGCHSRRSQLVAAPTAEMAFLDAYSPSLMSPSLYHADGRIDGEVFEFGSFAQSAMHRAGVTCANCHDPHSGALKAPGNALCSQCHLPSRYDVPAHHGQTVGSDAAQCVSCHMPSKTYMGVHVRRDHGLKKPAAPPAFAAEFAAEFEAAWQASSAGLSALGPMLAALAADSAFIRASALATPAAGQAEALAQSVSHPDPLVRLGAARGLAYLPPREAVALGTPLLADPRRAVRVEAARALLGTPAAWWNEAGARQLQAATADLINADNVAADRPEAQLNLALIYARLGQRAEAEQALRQTLLRAPDFVPVYLTLADLYRQWQRDADGEPLLRQVAARAPTQAEPAHALGLWLVRQGRVADAVPWLAQAHRAQPARVSYALVHSLALAQTGQGKAALDVLVQARGRYPDDLSLLSAQIEVERGLGLTEAARTHGLEYQQRRASGR
jgi:predicted CXXCH cytochrome family protein